MPRLIFKDALRTADNIQKHFFLPTIILTTRETFEAVKATLEKKDPTQKIVKNII